MRYLGASSAVLATAMTFSLTPLGWTAQASDDRPVVVSIIGRNALLPLSATSTSPINIERYGGKEKKPTELQGLALIIPPPTCEEIAVGTWTNITDTQACGKEKCGKVTTGTRTASEGSGFCGGKQFTFATISYEWTAHNNQSTLSAPPDKVADTFTATWTSGTTPNITQQYTFNINVPVVRPDHEKTVFERWSPDLPTVGEWKQKLVPPRSDPTFDFSGESVQETAALGVPGEDNCWFRGSDIPIVLSITGGIWPVNSGNVWKPDQVGWKPDAVTYYRNPTPPPTPPGTPPGPPPPSPVPCGFTIQQQMTIKAPSDGITFNNYGPVNVLEGKITQKEVTSERAGKSKTKKWP